MGRQSLEALSPETVLKGRGPQTVLGSPEPVLRESGLTRDEQWDRIP